MRYVLALTLTLLFGPAVGIGPQAASANECRAFGARSISSSWNWHYPRETPTVRNGNRKVVCKSGRQGWLYTRDDISGQYFVTNTSWQRKTGIHGNLCTAVAQYCQ